MKKILMLTTVIFLLSTLYLAYLWVDVTITRSYEIESDKVAEEAYRISSSLLNDLLGGQDRIKIIEKLTQLSVNYNTTLIDETVNGDGEVWFGSVKFEFNNNKLISVGK